MLMPISLPHPNPRQLARLRSLVGAVVAIVLTLVLIGLLAFFLVFPNTSLAFKVEPNPKNNTGDPVYDRPLAPAAPAQPATKRVTENSSLQTEIGKIKALANRAPAFVPARGRTPPGSAQIQVRTAAWVLGLLHLHGMGMVQDPAQALFWFKQANELGEPLAAAGLAWCALEGCDALPDPSAARPWVAQLRAVKPGRALYLDWLIESTLSPLQINSANSALEIEKLHQARKQLLLNAAKLQDAQALIELGFDSVAAERAAEAQSYFQTAAANSKVAADNAKLVVRRQGDQKTLCQVSNAEELTANTLLASAQALHRGDRCQVNYFESIRLYNLAAAKGNVIAKRMLALIYSRPGPAGGINITWMQQLANMNVNTLSPTLDSPGVSPMLRREPTAVSDLIPPYLRRLAEN